MGNASNDPIGGTSVGVLVMAAGAGLDAPEGRQAGDGAGWVVELCRAAAVAARRTEHMMGNASNDPIGGTSVGVLVMAAGAGLDAPEERQAGDGAGRVVEPCGAAEAAAGRTEHMMGDASNDPMGGIASGVRETVGAGATSGVPADARAVRHAGNAAEWVRGVPGLGGSPGARRDGAAAPDGNGLARQRPYRRSGDWAGPGDWRRCGSWGWACGTVEIHAGGGARQYVAGGDPGAGRCRTACRAVRAGGDGRPVGGAIGTAGDRGGAKWRSRATTHYAAGHAGAVPRSLAR